MGRKIKTVTLTEFLGDLKKDVIDNSEIPDNTQLWQLFKMTRTNIVCRILFEGVTFGLKADAKVIALRVLAQDLLDASMNESKIVKVERPPNQKPRLRISSTSPSVMGWFCYFSPVKAKGTSAEQERESNRMAENLLADYRIKNKFKKANAS